MHQSSTTSKLGLASAVLAGALLGTPLAADTGGSSPNGVRYHGGDEIILQGFHWNVVRTNNGDWYDTLKNMASTIASDGFTAVWMPPPWRDFSSWSDPQAGTSGGGEGYFWHDFDKNSQYGSDWELQQALGAFNQNGVKAVFDAVPNHMNRGYTPKNINFPAGQGYWRNDCPDYGSNIPNNCDDGDRFIGGEADLNTGRSEIFTMFRNEFSNLRNNYSAGGFRFDFVRGYAAERVNAWMGQAHDSGFCVGELWKSPSEYQPSEWQHNASWQEILKDWSDRAKCTIFDFALKERMQNAGIRDWQYGLNGNPDPRWREVAVTFVDNHDTGYSPGPNGGQHHWPLNGNLRKKAYAYTLSSPGTPVVFWPHMYDWGLGNDIRNLISIRRSVDVRADSPIEFHNNFSGLNATVTGNNGKLVLALDSNLSGPNQVAQGNFNNVMTADNGSIRIWTTTGGNNGGTATVNFECQNGQTQWGDSVYVVGNQPELGNWSAAQAALLTDTSNYPTWKGSLELTGGANVEWKCIIRSESDPNDVKQWESGANNTVTATDNASTTGAF